MRAQKSRYAGLPEGASVSFSRYGGPPADPFGGQPFGGWPGPPSEPPVFRAPPPQARETNPLATLSIVFAFLFAPAGAVLGHVALSQIKRLHQQGRDRAVIGLALSYFILLLLVVALVVWLVLPRESNSSNVSVSKHSIKDFLLSGPELGELFDQSFDDLPRSSSSGGFDRMPDATNPSAGAQPVDCVSPVTPADRNAYRSAGVTEFASQVWPNRLGVLDQRVLSVTEVVTTLPSVESAETLDRTADPNLEAVRRADGDLLGNTASGRRLSHPQDHRRQNRGAGARRHDPVRTHRSTPDNTTGQGRHGEGKFRDRN
ncbi:hypothetical protein A5654_06230 [Mycolicibacterium fortuitum]|nr:hypothetical protein A5654_06230 [Mycolicibacterium fortuitum]